MERTEFDFRLGDRRIDVCDTYKYLGIVLNEHLDYTEANAQSESVVNLLEEHFPDLLLIFLLNEFTECITHIQKSTKRACAHHELLIWFLGSDMLSSNRYST